MKQLIACALSLLLSQPGFAATPGWVGFAATHSLVSYSGQWDAFPGLDVDGSGKRFVAYGSGGNETAPGAILAKVSSTGNDFASILPTTIYTSPSGYWSDVADVTYVASLSAFVVLVTEENNAYTVTNNYVVICTVSGSTITVISTTTIPTPSGWSAAWTIGKMVVEANGHFLMPVYGTVSGVMTAALLLNTDGTAKTWTAPPIVVATASGSVNSYSESAFVQIPVGYPNAGRLIGVLRNDGSSAGYFTTYSDTPETTLSYSTPANFLSEPGYAVGKPVLAFVPQTTNGGLFLMMRWEETSSTFYIANAFTGYTFSWDQGNTWLPVRNYVPTTVAGQLVQYWYASATWIPANSTIGVAVGLNLYPSSQAAWVVYQEFQAAPPQ